MAPILKSVRSFTMDLLASSTKPNNNESPFSGLPAGVQLFGSLQFALLAPVQFRSAPATDVVNQPPVQAAAKPRRIASASACLPPMSRHAEPKLRPDTIKKIAFTP